ncbi:MAG: hypothetical protein AAFY57_08730 [Cyanobacteria bacterium J06642_2]
MQSLTFELPQTIPTGYLEKMYCLISRSICSEFGDEDITFLSTLRITGLVVEICLRAAA